MSRAASKVIAAEGRELDLTRELLLRHGWNTTCYQILNPGIERWFSARHEAVIGYVKKAGVRVVAGAPVCPEPDLPGVLDEWEHASSDRLCYFGAEDRMRDIAATQTCYSTVVLGAQPVWSPASFVERFQADKSLRAQHHRAVNKGVTIEEWPARKAEQNPLLSKILEEWLATRGLPPMHFLVEPETLGMLQGRRVFVASQNEEARGFLVLSPIPAQNGWLTEQFVRGKKAPNGTIELLMWWAAQRLADEGAEMLTQGIVPLSKRADDAAVQNPAWLKLIAQWARAHGRRFYNFGGLDWFKDKFHPDRWEPIYVISREPNFSPRTLYAVAAAFTGVNPLAAVAKGIGRAAAQELTGFSRRAEPHHKKP
jgi:phosphatidylglycerol lysyltransferase